MHTNQPLLLTREQVAQRLGVSERLVRRLTDSRAIDSIKIGNRVRIPAEAVERYISEHLRPSREPQL